MINRRLNRRIRLQNILLVIVCFCGVCACVSWYNLMGNKIDNYIIRQPENPNSYEKFHHHHTEQHIKSSDYDFVALSNVVKSGQSSKMGTIDNDLSKLSSSVSKIFLKQNKSMGKNLSTAYSNSILNTVKIMRIKSYPNVVKLKRWKSTIGKNESAKPVFVIKTTLGDDAKFRTSDINFRSRLFTLSVPMRTINFTNISVHNQLFPNTPSQNRAYDGLLTRYVNNQLHITNLTRDIIVSINNNISKAEHILKPTIPLKIVNFKDSLIAKELFQTSSMFRSSSATSFKKDLFTQNISYNPSNRSNNSTNIMNVNSISRNISHISPVVSKNDIYGKSLQKYDHLNRKQSYNHHPLVFSEIKRQWPNIINGKDNSTFKEKSPLTTITSDIANSSHQNDYHTGQYLVSPTMINLYMNTTLKEHSQRIPRFDYVNNRNPRHINDQPNTDRYVVEAWLPRSIKEGNDGTVNSTVQQVLYSTRNTHEGKQLAVNSPVKRLPQALIIGVKKCGTRALLEFLKVHPDVRASGPETHFFDRHYQKGLQWYRQQMPSSLEGQITMEKTPSYYITKEVPPRIRDMSPSVRLMIVVRDPVTRAISDYTQSTSKTYRRKKEATPSFEDMVFLNTNTGLVDTSWSAIRIGVYSRFLEWWIQYFSLEQILFISGENLVQDPAGEMEKVQEFLGLKPVISDKHFYFNETKGFPCLKKSEGSGNPHCLGKTKGRAHPNISLSTIQRLRDFYRPFNDKFYRMVGRNFGWS